MCTNVGAVSVSAAHASAFFRELAAERSVWTIEDGDGVPALLGSDGARAMPFWSRRSRVERVITTFAAYTGFRPREISRDEFEERWLPGMHRDGFRVGLN